LLAGNPQLRLCLAPDTGAVKVKQPAETNHSSFVNQFHQQCFEIKTPRGVEMSIKEKNELANPDQIDDAIRPDILVGELLRENKVVENKDDRIQYYYDEVIKHYKTSVEGIIQMGVTLYQAKKELKKSFRELAEMLPFGSAVASYLVTISQNSILANPEYRDKLPSKYNTLYALAQLPDDILEEKLINEEITPAIKGAVVKSWKSNKRENKKRSTFEFRGAQGEKLFEVGLIGIANVDKVDEFQEALDSLLKNHNGKTKYAQTVNSLAEWNKGQLLKKANNKIIDTAPELGGTQAIAEIRALDVAMKYLDAPRNKKAEVISNNKKERIGLPSDHESYDLVSELLGTKDVTKSVIEEFCKTNMIPCRAADPKTIDKEVYVWELLRQIAESKNSEKEMAFLKTMSTENSHEKVKEAADKAWKDATRYHNI
jgi:hypothetical protein